MVIPGSEVWCCVQAVPVLVYQKQPLPSSLDNVYQHRPPTDRQTDRQMIDRTRTNWAMSSLLVSSVH